MSESVRESAKQPESTKEDRTSQTRTSDYSEPANSSIDRILFLQRTIGNQAVNRLIKSGALQAKLKIGQPGNEYEREINKMRVIAQMDESDDNYSQSDELQPPDESTGNEELGTSICPITAVFSSMVVGSEKAACLVPTGKFGVSRLARFRLIGVQTGPGAFSVTINEKFSALDDPYSAFGLLQPNSFTTSGSVFDDCYMLASSNPLPADFVLKVEQNHLLKGQIISRNQITFRPDLISFCTYRRSPGGCDFGGRCRLG